MDDYLKGFGDLTGLPRGCVITEQRVKLERAALDLNAAIARLFGSDRAFMFATSFDYGTSVEIKVDECKNVLKRYESRVARLRERGGATP